MELLATELRLGNYVWEDYSGYMIVRGISPMDITLVKQISMPSGKYSIDKIEPIPITEEILLKCGFKKLNNILNKAENCVISKDLSWIGIYAERMDDDAVFDCPKSLHQLQNLYFAITGEELPINL